MDLSNDASKAAADFLDSTEMEMDTRFVPQAVLPGDDVTSIVTRCNQKIKIGAGLARAAGPGAGGGGGGGCGGPPRVRATRAGALRYRPPNTYWVAAAMCRFTPQAEDRVLGIVEGRSGDFYRVNIFANSSALLPLLGFEGATKKNKPNLKPGALVYCRVAHADRDMEPELTCTSSQGGVKKDWMTGQATFGPLKGGAVVRVSLAHAAQLLDPSCTILHILGSHMPYEVAIGMNGGIWINSGSSMHTIIVCNAILNSEGMNDDEKEAMVEQMISSTL